MTHDEIERMKKRIYDGLDMVMERAEKIGKEKSNYSIEELYMMTDIVKDSAEAFKNLAKTHKYFSEHSIERY